MKLTRILVYEGPDTVVARVLFDSLKDGVHYIRDNTGSSCRVAVATADTVPSLAGLQLSGMVQKLVVEGVIPDTAKDIEVAKRTQYLGG